MESDKSTDLKVIVFALGEERYAVDVQHVESIERLTDITRVPEAPPYVKGVINLRGVVTPVVDLRMKLGVTAKPFDAETRILIVRVGDLHVGLIVDRADDVVDLPPSAVVPPPEVVTTVRSTYVEGIAHLGESLVVLLNLTRVLSDEEREAVQRIEG
ncbi:MAG: purine-binding chemotaxis protein CheW [Hydrogenibacillus sp.]|nr:purine-binding chemotaxis protein CheW [Hydrogenibacillus sp.]MBE3595914.1 purine-binding chemotaxis protein CheW [Hydrogenibacillus sp.]